MNKKDIGLLFLASILLITIGYQHLNGYYMYERIAYQSQTLALRESLKDTVNVDEKLNELKSKLFEIERALTETTMLKLSSSYKSAEWFRKSFLACNMKMKSFERLDKGAGASLKLEGNFSSLLSWVEKLRLQKVPIAIESFSAFQIKNGTRFSELKVNWNE